MCDAIRIAHSQIATDAKKFFSFFTDAKRHSRVSEITGKCQKKSLRKSCDFGLRCEKSGCFLRSSDAKCLRFGLPLRFGLRCEHPRCQIASDVGRTLRTTKGGQNCTQRCFESFINFVRPATLNNCKGCPQTCPDSRRRFFLRQRYGCGCGAFCDAKWPKFVKAARLQSEFCKKDFSLGYEFSYEECSENFPKFLSLSLRAQRLKKFNLD